MRLKLPCRNQTPFCLTAKLSGFHPPNLHYTRQNMHCCRKSEGSREHSQERVTQTGSGWEISWKSTVTRRDVDCEQGTGMRKMIRVQKSDWNLLWMEIQKKAGPWGLLLKHLIMSSRCYSSLRGNFFKMNTTPKVFKALSWKLKVLKCKRAGKTHLQELGRERSQRHKWNAKTKAEFEVWKCIVKITIKNSNLSTKERH